jgi:hypothetical protein
LLARRQVHRASVIPAPLQLSPVTPSIQEMNASNTVLIEMRLRSLDMCP